MALIAALASYAALFLLKLLFCNKVQILTGKTKTEIDDVVAEGFKQTKQWFLIIAALYIGFQFLPKGYKYYAYADKTFFIALMIQVVIWGNKIISVGLEKIVLSRSKKNPAAASSLSLLNFVFKIIFFALAILFTLTNMGIKVTPIVAGLGVTGVAVALAVQNILGDLFSSLSIVLDKPFVVGDFVVLESWQGTVEKIGLKSTRIRSLSGEQIVLANSDLLQSRIRNYKRMVERRVPLTFNLTYNTTPAKINEGLKIIEEIIKKEKLSRFDRAHLGKLGTDSLELEVVYWVLSAEFNIHMDVQQRILLAIYESFKKSEIEFAFPAYTVYLHHCNSGKITSPDSKDESKET